MDFSLPSWWGKVCGQPAGGARGAGGKACGQIPVDALLRLRRSGPFHAELENRSRLTEFASQNYF